MQLILANNNNIIAKELNTRKCLQTFVFLFSSLKNRRVVDNFLTPPHRTFKLTLTALVDVNVSFYTGMGTLVSIAGILFIFFFIYILIMIIIL